MANCYLVLKPNDGIFAFPSDSRDSNGSQISSTGQISDSGSFTFIIPDGIIFTEAIIGHTWSNYGNRTTYATITGNNGQTNFSDSNGNSQSLYGSGNTEVLSNLPIAGEQITFSCIGRLNVTWLNTAATGTNQSANGSFRFNPYLQLTIELPNSETTITAATLNSLASILGTTTVTVGDNITLSPWQEIGTAIGNMTSSATSTTPSGTAVTFDTTMPLASNLNSVLTNMENKYIILECPKVQNT